MEHRVKNDDIWGEPINGGTPKWMVYEGRSYLNVFQWMIYGTSHMRTIVPHICKYGNCIRGFLKGALDGYRKVSY